MKSASPVCLLFLLLTIASCKDDVMVDIPEYDPKPFVLNYGTFPAPDLPADNDLTIQKHALGRMLFHERDLSGNGTQSCADCHLQQDGFSDTRTFSLGIDNLPGRRNAMALINLAWHQSPFFWDGRSPTLRDQALKPIQDPLEMHESLENVVNKLSKSKTYTDQFIRAFGDPEISPERIAMAIEQFEISLISNNSKFDQYQRGERALSPSEERGRQLFFGEFDARGIEKGAECFHCHGGFNFTNNRFMNNGLDADAEFSDPGLFEVSQKSGDMAKFKVPTLRNIEVTGPYMHDGRFETLREVLDHYNEGVKNSSTVDVLMRNNIDPGLGLTEEDLRDLENFLLTLTDLEFLNNPQHTSPF